jgi:proline iminopeptidase
MDRRAFAKGLVLIAAAQRTGHTGMVQSRRSEENATIDLLNPPGVQMAGIRMVPVVAGKYKVWTKKIGDGKVKVLLLHGGPGMTHEYLEAMESFLPAAGVEMYYYDQLGCGNSDKPEDLSLWSLPRYVEEVEEVRRGLGLDQFVLYGHSWGGILALEYALKYQHHLRGLVISNMAAGMTAYLARAASLKVRLLTREKQGRLALLEEQKAFDSAEYQSIMQNDLYPQMICRTKPWPEPVTRAGRHANDVIYNPMQGKSEFLMTGNLKEWERWERLPEIQVKTLTFGSLYDEMDPEDMRRMSKLVQRGTFAYCPSGSHLCMWDDQIAYFRQLTQFLRRL